MLLNHYLNLQRITWLLMKMDNERRRDKNDLSHKFMGQIEAAFKSLPEPTENHLVVNEIG